MFEEVTDKPMNYFFALDRYDALPILLLIGFVALLFWAIPRWVSGFLEGVRRGLRDGDQ
ncbi:MAG TPA: hypothetical protein VMV29_05030 [Ktedonobacterales bacterium]|nr:hypothetical protein [Ktedonobacterales bacterium]